MSYIQSILFVEQHFGGFKDLPVADLGCSDGIDFRLAKANGFPKVIVIDTAQDMIELAKPLSSTHLCFFRLCATQMLKNI